MRTLSTPRYRARREQLERWTVISMQHDWMRILAFDE